jgi:predicted XRE-type DNA-binding protein
MIKEEYESHYYSVLMECNARYRTMMEESKIENILDSDLYRFNELFFVGIAADKLPIPKLCRWLGFIQAGVIQLGLTTVEQERDWSRPLFRPLDFPITDNEVKFKQELVDIVNSEILKTGITKTELARRLNTSRAQLDRLLDPEYECTTLKNLINLTNTLGIKLTVKSIKEDESPFDELTSQ